jgi:hypothetical protein
MKEYAVNGDVLQKILTYLASKPYLEVHELVKGLQATSRELPDTGDVAPEATSIGSGTNGTSASATGSNGSGATAQAASA